MKTAIKKVGGNYKVIFTHGVQTFTLDYNGTKKECQWYKDRLDECFKKYLTQQQPIEQPQPQQLDNSLRELEKILNDYLIDEEIEEIRDALKALKPLDKEDGQDKNVII